MYLHTIRSNNATARRERNPNGTFKLTSETKFIFKQVLEQVIRTPHKRRNFHFRQLATLANARVPSGSPTPLCELVPEDLYVLVPVRPAVHVVEAEGVEQLVHGAVPPSVLHHHPGGLAAAHAGGAAAALADGQLEEDMGPTGPFFFNH